MKPLLSLFTLLTLLSCTPTPDNVQKSNDLPPIYPDYCDITIPENIAPLNFLIRDDRCEAIEVRAGEIRVNASGNEAVFDIDDWKDLLQQSAGQTLTVTVSALISGQWIEYRPFEWQVVKDKIDPYLTYRLIEPDYEIWNQIQIQQRCLENFDVNAIGHYEQLENRCMNCHTYGSQSPDLSMMYVRGSKGGAFLNQNGKLRKLAIKTDDMVSGSVYFGFSPSGRYITFSTSYLKGFLCLDSGLLACLCSYLLCLGNHWVRMLNGSCSCCDSRCFWECSCECCDTILCFRGNNSCYIRLTFTLGNTHAVVI